MTLEQIISYGILLMLIGTPIAGLIALIGGRSAYRRSYTLLAVVNAFGALSALLFLSNGLPKMTVMVLPVVLGGSLIVDSLSAVFLLLIATVASLCCVYAIPYLAVEEKTYHLPSLTFIVALFLLGMQMVPLCSTVMGFMFFWEMMSLASFFLVMADGEDASVRAAFLYLVMTQLGAGAIMAGFFLLGGGPLLSFASIAQGAEHLSLLRLAAVFALFQFGFGSKAGLVPFHLWLPEAHPQAPSPVSALMSGVMLKVAVYGFIRMMFELLPGFHPAFGLVVIVLGLASAVVGVLRAVIHRDIKRLLAFSSIENIGLMFTMIGVSMFAQTYDLQELAVLALIAALFHAFNHALFKAGLFLAAGVFVHSAHSRSMEMMGGFAKRMPFFTMAFCTVALSAAALPPLGTFFGEWLFLQGILETLDAAPLFVRIVLAFVFLVTVFVSGLAVFAMVKLFAITTLGEPRSEAASDAREPSLLLNAPVSILAVLSLLTGIAAPGMIRTLSPALTSRAVFPPALHVMNASISPAFVFIVPAIILLLVYVFWRLAAHTRMRSYHTWDCGQPITAGMEYTSTAFSAPLRFFFRFLLHTRKHIIAEPVVATNPWIARRTATLTIESVMFQGAYRSIGKAIHWSAMQVRKIQSGVIQFYLLLIFLALIISLFFAL